MMERIGIATIAPFPPRAPRVTYEEEIAYLASLNDDLIVLTAENRASIRNLPLVLGKRFIDVGICEQTLVGTAAGLALRGRTPIAHALAAFLILRAFEFVRTDVGIAGLPVKLVGGAPGFLSEANGPTHQAIEDVALMRSIPGMHIFCPADEEELIRGLPAVIESRSPWYIRFNAAEAAVTHSTNFEPGKAEVVSEGSDVSILVYGFLLAEAVRAAAILEDEGTSVRLINLRTLVPIDEETIVKAARETSMLVTLEDHLIVGGLYSIVAEILLRQNGRRSVMPIAFRDKWFKPALLGDALEYEGFTGPQIASRILLRLDGQLKP
jgi:transketolase